MQLLDMQAEISALEIQVRNLERKLDLSFSNNEILAKTKEIFHELRLATEKLKELKSLSGEN
jgi:hypothetical protein